MLLTGPEKDSVSKASDIVWSCGGRGLLFNTSCFKSCDKKFFNGEFIETQGQLSTYLFHPNSPICILWSCGWYWSLWYLMVLL